MMSCSRERHQLIAILKKLQVLREAARHCAEAKVTAEVGTRRYYPYTRSFKLNRLGNLLPLAKHTTKIQGVCTLPPCAHFLARRLSRPHNLWHDDVSSCSKI